MGFADIDRWINESKLSDKAKRDVQSVFVLVAQNGAEQCQVPAEHVRIRQSDAVNAIIQIAGVAAALDMLGIETCYSVNAQPTENSWDTLIGSALMRALCRKAEAKPTSSTAEGRGVDEFTGDVLRVCLA